ncbi:MAG: hypothetical protein ABIO55_06550 [Ginsengibacter sp.]
MLLTKSKAEKTKSKVQKTFIDTDFRFSKTEKDYIYSLLISIKENPYTGYEQFIQNIRDVVSLLPSNFLKHMEELKTRDQYEFPFVYIENCPIDRILPIFDYVDPVNSKRKLKKTFIAEGFLSLYGEMMETPAIGYINVNNGDTFHDIYPQESLKNSQSQKTMVALGFHKDLANHFVRPDHINMMAMRFYEQNKIYTTFVRNKDLLDSLPGEMIEIMRREVFYTPFDDLTMHAGNVQLGRAKDHAILKEDDDICYFENRTTGINKEAQDVCDTINMLLHKIKFRIQMKPGDFVSLANNFSVHGKDIEHIADIEQQRIRWSIKTYNVNSLAKHEQHYIPGRYGIVNG